jgi:hypothetical protein
VAFLTLGYHAEWGLAPKNETFTIVYGENYCEQRGERITGETISEGALQQAFQKLQILRLGS